LDWIELLKVFTVVTALTTPVLVVVGAAGGGGAGGGGGGAGQFGAKFPIAIWIAVNPPPRFVAVPVVAEVKQTPAITVVNAV
jgi:hypothetical protein